MLSAGLDLPETGINKSKPPIYALPPRYISLGAYLSQGCWSGVHRTYRKGMREFNHDAFSQIYQAKNTANFQLHTWEYLIAEKLTGYIVADTPEGLENFQKVKAYGCKIGKEGFAFVAETSDILELHQKTVASLPSTVAPADALLQSNQFGSGCDIYNLYHYQQPSDLRESSPEAGFLDATPSEVDGFVPFVAAYFGNARSNPPTLDYYTDDQDIYIPVSLVNLLRG